jgi:SRSO17 transposase
MSALAAVELPALTARDRLLAFTDEVVASFPHVRQRENALLYVRGLVEHGGRKSLQPTLFRLGEPAARYESLQQFLADSPWDPALLLRACAERVVPELDPLAWIVDDTGIKKDGIHSPGVKRQWSGTLGKIDNCQITVSLHAVGQRGSQPLGWALYLPEEWCEDSERRAKAKIPPELCFRTKGELAGELIEQAASWQLPGAPILADCAYGDDTKLRSRLDAAGREYVVSVSPATTVYPAATRFSVPERRGARGRPPQVARPDREPVSVRELAGSLPGRAWRMLPCRDTPSGEQLQSRFALLRVTSAHEVRRDHRPPRSEWLVIEWPDGAEAPSDYWLSNLADDCEPERLARLARLRWMIELDYRQLKGELGLDHYEGRSYAGFHHHCALVSCAHAFLTLERGHPKAPRPV